MNTAIHLEDNLCDLDAIMKRSYAAIDRQVRVTAPKWLRRAGHDSIAAEFETIPAVVDWDSWRQCWPLLAATCHALRNCTGTPQDKTELWADGWTIDNSNGRWAAQEKHWRSKGAIVRTAGVDETFDGPFVSEASSMALGYAYAIVKAAALKSQVAA